LRSLFFFIFSFRLYYSESLFREKLG